MSRYFLALETLVFVFAIAVPAAQVQQLKSGPQVDETIQGSFQPLNINGPFAGRYHCLITEFRLKPVVLVFAAMQSDNIDPEVKKLLEAIDKTVEDRHSEGIESFAVFLTPQARSSATQDKAGDGAAAVTEAKERERLVNYLKEEAKSLKRLVVTCIPPESVAEQYKLADNAEVTVLVYNRHRIHANFAFGRGQLNQSGIDSVLKDVDAMLGKVKKGADW